MKKIKKENCLVCERIDWIKQNKNPYFVKELETGYVVLGDYQFYRGYTLFLCKIHTNELHKLNKDFRKKYLEEMAIVAEAVYKTFKPKKLNYELLGNTDSHLHWHIFPRYENDPNPGVVTWIVDKNIRYNEKYKLSQEELNNLKKRLLINLDKLL